ncbi:MAG: PaaI family thioesterase [Proteobacteria bacterium]|nr:PaaI family thioesterase [Pseudomonadota bacterium]
MTWATDRLDAIKAKSVEPPPVVRTLQLGLLDDWSAGVARKRWLPNENVLNGDGSMFGGYIAALADQMLGFAAMTVIPEGSAFRTVNLNVQFFRVGRAHPLDIEARVTAATKAMITVEADFKRDDGQLIARASAQQIVTPYPNAA